MGRSLEAVGYTGGLTAAAGGICASLLAGLLAALVAKSRDQN